MKRVMIVLNSKKQPNEFVPFEDHIAILRVLMEEESLRPKDLVEILGVSKGLVSDILNRKKPLSKNNIEILSEYFRVDIVSFTLVVVTRRQRL